MLVDGEEAGLGDGPLSRVPSTSGGWWGRTHACHRMLCHNHPGRRDLPIRCGLRHHPGQPLAWDKPGASRYILGVTPGGSTRTPLTASLDYLAGYDSRRVPLSAGGVHTHGEVCLHC